MTIADEKARQEALDTGHSYIVQAPAGSGKTTLLIQRFLSLLAQVEHPEEILAITFTRKAASEMRQRLLDALSSANDDTEIKDHQRITRQLAQQALIQAKKHRWNLTDQPNRLRIQTIDSLCYSLVSQMPLLSSLGGISQIDDHPQDAYLLAAERAILQLVNDRQHQPIIEMLKLCDNNFNQLARLLSRMLGSREYWGSILLHDDINTLKNKLESSLVVLVNEKLDELETTLPHNERLQLFEFIDTAAANLINMESPIRDYWFEALNNPIEARLNKWRATAEIMLTKKNQPRKSLTINQGFPRTAKEKARKQDFMALMDHIFSQYQGFIKQLITVRELPNMHYSQTEWGRIQNLLILLRLALVQLHLSYAESGDVDYSEILLRTLTALGDEDSPTDLALQLDYRISHILVDEFQDTNQGQYQLLKKLTAGWQAGDGRTLFCVGDPMQSIYRFRHADVSLFLTAMHHGIGQIKLKPLQLCSNFRSSEAIINWVNASFSNLFPQQQQLATGAVSYAASEAIQNGQGGVSLHPCQDNLDEATKLIQIINQSQSQDIAILVYSRTHLVDIINALRQANINYKAVELESLSTRQIIQDLLSITRILINPCDQIAWLAMLRAPWCGLKLDALHRIANFDDNKDFEKLLREPPDTLDNDATQRLNDLSRVLEPWLKSRQRRSLTESVRGIWTAVGGPALIESEIDTETAELFFITLEQVTTAGWLDHHRELEQRLESLFAPGAPSSDRQIQIMTIHKAKGLEFDTVIIPGLGRSVRSDDKQLLLWTQWQDADNENLLGLAPLYHVSEQEPRINTWLKTINRLKRHHEETRLLYVATTRAIQHLYVLGTANWSDKQQSWQAAGSSMMKLLWPLFEEYFEALEKTDRPVEESIPGTHRLKRIRSDWKVELPQAVALEELNKGEFEIPESPDYFWVQPLARRIGIVIHQYLKIMSTADKDWTTDTVNAAEVNIRQSLLSFGVPKQELKHAAARVIQALTNTLNDDKGRWILQSHIEAESEYSLTYLDNGRFITRVIDRTFIDNAGFRWIIDYKNSDHLGTDLNQFLNNEVLRYSPQLRNYQEIMAQLDSRPIKCALYFPFLQAFIEVKV